MATDAASRPAPRAASRWPGALGWLGRALIWLPAVLLGVVLAGALAVGLWAGSDGSLAQAVRWGLAWQAENAPQAGEVRADGAQGSVLNGGTLSSLSWTRDGLSVQAQDLSVDLGARFWAGLLGGEVHLGALQAARMQVTDARAPTPPVTRSPIESLVLPLPVELAVAVDELVLADGQALENVRAQYRYGSADRGLGVADAHTLTLRSLRWADGRYQAQATLGAQAPMPLRLQVSGELRADVPEGGSIDLRARATAQGTLAGEGAVLDLTAQITPAASNDATPTLAGTARVRPWAAQPVAEADLRLHRLNVALLWPTAPQTALTGTVRAQPAGSDWRAQLQLQNESSGAIDRGRVPVRALDLALVQSGDRWTLERLDAQVAGGRLQGQGRRDAPAGGAASSLGDWQGDVALTGIDPAQLWSRLAPAALDGRLQARAVNPQSTRPAIDIDARIAPAGRQPRASAADALRLREVQLQGRWQPSAALAGQGTLTVRRARIDALDGRLDAEGSVDTAAPSGQGRVALSVPGLRALWTGAVARAEGQGDLALELADGAQALAWLRALQDAPTIGAPLRQALEPLAGVGLEARADARLRWQGGLGAFGFPGAGGRVAPPTVSLDLQATRVRLQRAGDAPLDVSLDNTRLRLQGPPDALALELQGRLARAPWAAAVQTRGQLALGLSPLDGRRGALRLDQLDIAADSDGNPVRWTLAAPAPLGLRWQSRPSGLEAELDAASLRLQPRRAGSEVSALTIAWERSSWQSGALQTRGRLDGLPLAWIDALALEAAQEAPNGAARAQGPLARAGLGGDLVFDGRWDLFLPAQAAQPPRFNLGLQRRSGDLAVQTDGAFDENTTRGQRVQAGVKQAQLQLTTDGPRVSAQLRWDSEQFGEASADLTSALSPPDDRHTAWHWAEAAPVAGRLQASLPQVGVWSVLAPPGWRVRGSLRAEAVLSGTRADPRFNGSLQADDLALRSLVNGIVFRGGELRATLAGERIVIERFRLEGRGGPERGGVLQASGSAEWRRVLSDGQTVREPLIELQATATRLRASTRADRRLTVTGDLRARLEGRALQLRGNLKADEALVVLPDELAPSLGDDVVVRGTEYPIERGSAVRVIPDVRVALDLGDAFELRGQGLRTRLAGQLEVRSAPTDPAPRVVGEVRTVSGSYRAYGQQLGIETGVLRFSGPYDNPALDILAVRPNMAQRVGVQITGTAQAPRVRLYADPDLPDSEKLAWLVLGRPASGAGAEAAVLQQAALALLAGADGGTFDGGLAGALGLDSLGFSGSGSGNGNGGDNSAAFTLGKRLADNLYLSYERSLAGTLNTVSVFYDVSRRFTVRARAGSENAIDLIFTLAYD